MTSPQRTSLDDYVAARFSGRPRTGSGRRPLLRALRSRMLAMLPEAWRKRRFRRKLDERCRREMEEHPERAVTVHETSGSADLVYVFQGWGLALNADTLSVLRDTAMLRRNFVLVRDLHRCYYHAGVSPVLPDLESVVGRLREVRASLPHVERVITFGTSAGGYGALLFAHLLEADAAYAFGPHTRIEPRELRQHRAIPAQWNVPPAHEDLALLLAQHNGRTRYEVFFCRDNRRDRERAERIAGCPGVALREVPGDSHEVVAELQRRQRLGDVLPPPLGVRTPESGR